MDLYLQGKTVVVSGGAKGIGAGIVEVFAQEGANIVVDYRSDPEQCETFIAGMAARYPQAKLVGIQADVSIPSEVERIFELAESTYGRLDILINNAAASMFDMFWDISLERWKEGLDANITSYFMMCKAFVDRLLPKQHPGRIVNILSKAAVLPKTPGRAIYATNKSAQLGFTRQLARDLAEKNIIVNGVVPGLVRNSRSTPESISFAASRSPRGVISEPIEIGRWAAFLSSDQCQLAIGSIVDTSDGLLLGL